MIIYAAGKGEMEMDEHMIQFYPYRLTSFFAIRSRRGAEHPSIAVWVKAQKEQHGNLPRR
jgi:hypothetical protein